MPFSLLRGFDDTIDASEIRHTTHIKISAVISNRRSSLVTELILWSEVIVLTEDKLTTLAPVNEVLFEVQETNSGRLEFLLDIVGFFLYRFHELVVVIVV